MAKFVRIEKVSHLRIFTHLIKIRKFMISCCDSGLCGCAKYKQHTSENVKGKIFYQPLRNRSQTDNISRTERINKEQHFSRDNNYGKKRRKARRIGFK